LKSKLEHLQSLVNAYFSGELSEEGRHLFYQYFDQPEFEPLLKEILQAKMRAEENPQVSQELLARVLMHLDQNVLNETRPVRRLWRPVWMVRAAVVLLMLGIGALLMFTLNVGSNNRPEANAGIIHPGGNKAYLSLENGRTIELRSDVDGVQVKGEEIHYEDGSLILDELIPQRVAFHTPRAGQYKISLPDGTTVWLNAESKLEYDIPFEGPNRVVTLDGEAYFEVKKDVNARPFVVETARKTIRVLGTKFNVQAYSNEPRHQTTLVEGSVAVRQGPLTDEVVMSPNEQFLLENSKGSIVKVDASDYVVWIQGLVLLNNYDLGEVLRHLERWYDVSFDEVPAQIRDKRVFGSLQKDVPLNDVLQSLERNYGVNFKIEGRRVRIGSN
jgi:transmembrane sensor